MDRTKFDMAGLTPEEKEVESLAPAMPKTDIDPKRYVPDTCANCGVRWLVPAEFIEAMKYAGGGICCPNGHNGSYSSRTVEIAKKTPRPLDTYHKVTCTDCGLDFLITKEMYEAKDRSRPSSIFCPNKHRLYYKEPEKPKEAPKPPVPKTEADIDYEKMITYFNALSGIALMKPEIFKNKKLLKTAINMARNALDLAKLKDDK